MKRVNIALSPLYGIARTIPRFILNQLYHTYILPYFDYCDVIYDGHLTITDELRLERLQNRAARLVTGAEFRTSTDALRRDLGWDLLKTRRVKHKLTFYRKLKYEQSFIPEYITAIIPENRQRVTGRTLRNAHLQTLPSNRTSSFSRSFVPDTTRLWNRLPADFHAITSTVTFKTALTNHISVPKPPRYYGLGSKRGNRFHTRLRLGMSCLHSHQYQILKTPSPQCSCGHPQENTQHFVLHCTHHRQHRTQMVANITQIIQKDFSSLPGHTQLVILLNGKGLTRSESCKVADEFQRFLLKTGRFEC